jgi:hypothetical protein
VEGVSAKAQGEDPFKNLMRKIKLKSLILTAIFNITIKKLEAQEDRIP